MMYYTVYELEGAAYSRRESLSRLSGAWAGIFFAGCSIAESALGVVQSDVAGKKAILGGAAARLLQINS
jgi:hypothetical protein